MEASNKGHSEILQSCSQKPPWIFPACKDEGGAPHNKLALHDKEKEYKSNS